jgi:hypothetical protein
MIIFTRFFQWTLNKNIRVKEHRGPIGIGNLAQGVLLTLISKSLNSVRP